LRASRKARTARPDYFIVDVNNAQLTEIGGMFEKKQLTIPVDNVGTRIHIRTAPDCGGIEASPISTRL